MTKRSLVFIALVLALASAACSSTGTKSSGPARATRDRNLITEAELAEVPQLNVFDAVRRLRPTWLRLRGRGTATIDRDSSIPVYLDGILRGSTRLLGRLRPSQVQEIRHMEPNEAAVRYGSTHRDGAIWVILKQGR